MFAALAACDEGVICKLGPNRNGAKNRAGPRETKLGCRKLRFCRRDFGQYTRPGPAPPGWHERSRHFAEDWRGKETLLVKLKLDPAATFVDTREGPGRQAFEAFSACHGKLKWYFDGKERKPESGEDLVHRFSEFVGAQVVMTQRHGSPRTRRFRRLSEMRRK